MEMDKYVIMITQMQTMMSASAIKDEHEENEL